MISPKNSCWDSSIGQKLPFPNYGQIHNYDFFAKINCRHNVAIDYVLNMRNKNIVVISFVVNIWVNTQTNWFVLNMSLFKGIFVQYTLKMNYGQINNYDFFSNFCSVFCGCSFAYVFYKIWWKLIEFDLAGIPGDILLSFEAFLALNLVRQARLLVGLSV